MIYKLCATKPSDSYIWMLAICIGNNNSGPNYISILGPNIFSQGSQKSCLNFEFNAIAYFSEFKLDNSN